jgi:hypothetical protein
LQVANGLRLPGRAAVAADDAEEDTLVFVVELDGEGLVGGLVCLDVTGQSAVLAGAVRAFAVQDTDEMGTMVVLIEIVTFPALAAPPKADGRWCALEGGSCAVAARSVS